MKYLDPLVSGRFLSREKRFFIHVRLDDGTEVVAHTNNTGTMRGCLFPGGEVWLSPARNPERKLKWTLELARTPEGVLVGVNTALANHLVREALEKGTFSDLPAWDDLKAEVRYENGKSRADFLLTGPEGPTWVEVKNVSWVQGGRGRFPDAPTERGRKHLRELMDRVAAGEQAALVFCLQRGDARTVGPADEIDPEYGRLLRQASQSGVRILALGNMLSPQGIEPVGLLPIDLDPAF